MFASEFRDPVAAQEISLMPAKSAAVDIRLVYLPSEALERARRDADRQVVFFGHGVESTTPATARSAQRAAREGLKSVSVFCNHITLPVPIKVHLGDPDFLLDGFSTIPMSPWPIAATTGPCAT